MSENSLSNPKFAPSPIAIAFGTDLHCPPNGQVGILDAIAWINAHDPLPEVLINGGDGNSPIADPRYREWVYMSVEEDGAGLDPRVIDLPVIGNHDTETPINAPYGTTPKDPHATIRADYPERFAGSDYYEVDLTANGTSVRIMVGNNLSDAINRDRGTPCYHNCNPPGDNALNPDRSGWTDPNSLQNIWFEDKSDSDHDWKLVAAHRPMWSNFDGPGRPMHREGREAMRIPIDNGVDLMLCGDQHVGCFAGRFHPDSEEPVGDSSNGAYALTLSGGYAIRTPDDTLLPAGSIQWSSAGSSWLGLVQMAIITFRGEQATIEIFQSGLNESPGVVFTGPLVRNRGLPS